jgi:formate dehydrogenase subunit delta
MSGTEHGGVRGADARNDEVQHGSTEHIVRMANDIGNFFRAELDRRVAIEGISNHINRFWTRRMRQKLLQYVAQGGNELDELPRAALAHVIAGAPAAPQAAASTPSG